MNTLETIKNLSSMNTLEEIRVLNNFYKYIKDNTDDCILETIKDFCSEFNVELEEIGYLISEDKYLKEYVESNLKRYRYIKRKSSKHSELLDAF